MQNGGRLMELPENARPREKLVSLGAASLSDEELLAIFLRTGMPGKNAIEMARELLRKMGGLVELSRASPQEISHATKGIGPAKAAELVAIFEVGKRMLRGDVRRVRFEDARAVYDYLAPEMVTLDRERLQVLLVNTRSELIRSEIVSVGSLNESIAHPREIFRPAVVHKAYGLIVAHNHPSGDPRPSEQDRRLTQRLAESAEILRVRLMDHLIIGTPDGQRMPYYSFREHGLL